MRKLTKILIICLLAVVYYYSCISYFWHKECMEYRRKEQHKQESMPRQIRVIYDICKSSKLEPIMKNSFADVWRVHDEYMVDLRTAAFILAVGRIVKAMERVS